LAPLVLLTKKELPISFEESISIVYKEELEEIFFQSNMTYCEDLYLNINYPEKDYGLSLDEFQSIYFYTLEWNPQSLNLYSKLNRDLSSSERNLSVPIWKYYLHFLFNALRKIPIWKGNHDVYRGVSKNLVKFYPEKYVIGNTITWYGFTSTTTNMGKVEGFLGNEESTIFCINGCLSGRAIQKFSGHPDEAEVLIPPGSRFTIVAIIKGKITLIQLNQIPTLEKR